MREENRVKQLSRFSWKLKNSGYNLKERKEIIVAGMRGFRKLEEKERNGIRNINRSRQENYNMRKLKKHKAKTGWYKQQGGERN